MPCWPACILATVLLTRFLWEILKVKRTERSKATSIFYIFLTLSPLLALFSLVGIKAIQGIPNGVSSEIQYLKSVFQIRKGSESTY